jgi:hypothetical protein
VVFGVERITGLRVRRVERVEKFLCYVHKNPKIYRKKYCCTFFFFLPV